MHTAEKNLNFTVNLKIFQDIFGNISFMSAFLKNMSIICVYDFLCLYVPGGLPDHAIVPIMK